MRKNILKFLLLSLVLSFATMAEARVYTGVEVFLAKYSNLLAGKRVGLITNQTGLMPKEDLLLICCINPQGKFSDAFCSRARY